LKFEVIQDSDKVFLNRQDITTFCFDVGDKVLFKNEFSFSNFIVSELMTLIPCVALIYSGSTSFSGNFNVNFFTHDVPEGLGFSGVCNSSIVEMQRIHI